MGKEIWMYLGYLLLVPSLLVNLYQFNRNQEQKSTYLVKEVLDGDTFATEDNSIIRLFSVDAPETGVCGGAEAKQALEDMILGKRVTLDVRTRDRGRQLAIVYLGEVLINKEVLKTGWFDYLGVNFEQKEELKEIYNQVKEEKVGIFGPKCTQLENTERPECSIKGNIGQERYYHFPGCGRYEGIKVELYRGEQWFCSEKEAQAAGFVKSKNCFDKKFTTVSSGQ